MKFRSVTAHFFQTFVKNLKFFSTSRGFFYSRPSFQYESTRIFNLLLSLMDSALASGGKLSVAGVPSATHSNSFATLRKNQNFAPLGKI